jgi:hypothetical protein
MDNELAWAIGLFEGEGCFSLVRGHPITQLKTTDPDVLERFAQIMDKNKIIGSVNGPYAHYGKKKAWRWQASGWHNFQRMEDQFGYLLGARRRARLQEILLAKPEKIRSEYRKINRDHPNRLVCLNQ